MFLRDFIVKTQQGRIKTNFFTIFNLGSYIGFAGAIIAHQDCCQMGIFFTIFQPFIYCFFKLGFNGFCNQFAI